MPHQPPDSPIDTTVRDELSAMRKIVTALDPLTPAAQDRVVGWLFDRYRRDAIAEDPQP